MATYNANVLSDPENLYNYSGYLYQASRKFWKTIKSKNKNVFARWPPFWLSVESWNSNQIISILMGPLTYKIGEIQ